MLFFWLLWGDFAFSLKERSIPTSMQLLLKQYKASDLVAGFLIGSLPQVISIFLSPIISYRSDRHRGRWGRRVPYLFIPTPIAFLSMIGLAFSPAIGRLIHSLLGDHSPGLNLSIILCFGVFWTVFEFCSITCNSVLSGLINDVVPRELLGRFFALFRIFSLLAGMAFSYFLLGGVEEHYVVIFLAIGALYFVAFTLMCFRVKEGSYPPVPLPPATADTSGRWLRFAAAVTAYIRECFTRPYYLWFFLSIALAAIAFQPINLFYVYFAQSVDMSMSTLGKYFAAQLFLSLLQAYPLGWLADKFHPLRVTIAALSLYAFFTLLAFFLIRGPVMLGVAQVLCGTIAGCWNTATAPLAPRLLPKMNYATFASAMGIVVSIGIMTSSTVSGRLLDLMNHDYRYVYLWACEFTLLALLATLAVYRRFMALGGPLNYSAPE